MILWKLGDSFAKGAGLTSKLEFDSGWDRSGPLDLLSAAESDADTEAEQFCLNKPAVLLSSKVFLF